MIIKLNVNLVINHVLLVQEINQMNVHPVIKLKS